jgi:topoisomerase IA-like protein
MPAVSRFIPHHQEQRMATYGKKAEEKVEKAMHERKHGTLRSGGSGKKVTSRKQAIAIGLSEARKAGGKVPAAKKATPRKTAAKKTTAKKTTARKTAAKKSTAAKKR